MTIIRDPKIEPFFIKKDAYCYALYETVTPQEQYATEDSVPYENVIGFYTDFANLLTKVASLKTSEKDSYECIQDYLDQYTQTREEIKNLIPKSIL